jgi:hypothetical protein
MGALSRSGSARDAVEAAERAKGTSRFLAVLRHGLFHLQLSLAADGADGGGRARIAARTPGQMNGRAAGRSRRKKSQEDDAARRVEKKVERTLAPASRFSSLDVRSDGREFEAMWPNHSLIFCPGFVGRRSDVSRTKFSLCRYWRICYTFT